MTRPKPKLVPTVHVKPKEEPIKPDVAPYPYLPRGSPKNKEINSTTEPIKKGYFTWCE